MSRPETLSVTGDLASADALARKIWGLRAETSNEALVLMTPRGTVSWFNDCAARLFSLVAGGDARVALMPSAGRGWLDRDSALFKGLHLINCGENDNLVWLLQDFTRIEYEKKTVIAVTTQNISVPLTAALISDDFKAEHEARLKHAAYHDDLTGLANRRHLKRYMETAEFQDAMARRTVGALLLDVDKFKEINDTLGHAAGDALLVHMARTLEKVLGPNDVACRTGGDEYVVFCIGPSNQEALLTRAELILRYAAEDLIWKGQPVRIGTSIGASLCSDGDETGEDLLHHADQALYAAKSMGRGRVVFFTPQIGQLQRAQNQMARELRVAVSEKQFEVLLQPQHNLDKDTISGCEALLRWNHPRLGQIAPGDFFDIARRAGVLSELDYHAMELSLDALKALDTAGFSDLFMAINVSAEILADADYPGLLDWAVQSRGLRPERICIEVNEMAINGKGAEAMKSAIERLKDFGARVALDDFGTGYSGLSHMSDCGVDTIKLDRSIIARLESEHRSRAILKSIVDLCYKLGTDVIAEGVETNAQREILKLVGCPHIQGYSVARPMSVSATIDWLSQFRGADVHAAQ
ncbi:MAG: bifunctional diguanylate cyclase/phosphodiesterase [Pseudomonadota bacterium]